MGASAPRQAGPGGDRARLEGRIDEVAYSGNTNHVYLENANRVPLNVPIRNQARATLPAAPKGVGKAGGDVSSAIGDRVRIGVSLGACHLFDADGIAFARKQD